MRFLIQFDQLKRVWQSVNRISYMFSVINIIETCVLPDWQKINWKRRGRGEREHVVHCLGVQLVSWLYFLLTSQVLPMANGKSVRAGVRGSVFIRVLHECIYNRAIVLYNSKTNVLILIYTHYAL